MSPAEMMKDPQMMSQMQEFMKSNPQMIESMMSSHPQFQNMSESQRKLLSDPNMIKMATEMMKNNPNMLSPEMGEGQFAPKV